MQQATGEGMNERDETQVSQRVSLIAGRKIPIKKSSVDKMTMNSYAFAEHKSKKRVVIITYDATTDEGKELEEFMEENLSRYESKTRAASVASTPNKKIKLDPYIQCKDMIVTYMPNMIPLSSNITIQPTNIKFDIHMSTKELKEQEGKFMDCFGHSDAIRQRMKDIFRAIEYIKFRSHGVAAVTSLLKDDYDLKDNSGISIYVGSMKTKGVTDKSIRSGQFQLLLLHLLKDTNQVFACLNVSASETQGHLSKGYTWVAKQCEKSDDEEVAFQECLKKLKDIDQVARVIESTKQQLCIE